VHRGDHRLRQAEQRAERRAEHRPLRQQLGITHRRPLLQVSADAEGALPGRGQHHRADLKVSRDLRADPRQAGGDGCAQRVHGLRPLQHDLADRAGNPRGLMPVHPHAAC